MMYKAVFTDEFLSHFRLDDNGKTLVLADTTGLTRAVTLEKVKHIEWVSCDERLPEEKGEYLVSYHPCYWDNVDKEITVGMDTFRGKTKWAKEKYQRVIAWMPLPKPYEVKEDNNDI